MNFDTSELPEEVEELLRPHLLKDVLPVIDEISSYIAARRDEAVNGRLASGVESIWNYCEEAYANIDDANRGELADQKWYKPMSPDGPLTTGQGPEMRDRRSTVYFGMTRRYVDAAAAKLSEILLPPDDKAFSIDEVPDPELIKSKGDRRQVLDDDLTPLTRAARMGEAIPQQQIGPGAGAPPVAAGAPMGPIPAAGGVSGLPSPAAAGPILGSAPPTNVVSFPGGAPGMVAPPPRVPLTVGDLAEEKIEFARAKAKKAEQRIFRWMTESNYTAENRLVIHEAAKLGVGVLKAPFPKMLRGIKVSDDGRDVEVEEKVIPGASAISVWDFFPDPTCGNCTHKGEYVFERDRMTEKQVRDLEGLPGYIPSQLAKVLEEGPGGTNIRERSGEGPSTDQSINSEKYMVWYYYGSLKRDEVESIEVAMGRAKTRRTSASDMPETMYVIATLINDTLVKVTFNPLNSGKFPYHAMPWQPRAGAWFGVGVAEQLMAPQRMANATIRAMLDNAGVSAGAQIVIDQTSVYPADDDWTIVPNKIWYKTGEGMAESVDDAFRVYNIPNLSRQLLEMINFFLRLAEESTSIPLVTQGNVGDTTPETLGGMQIQNNNANSLLRSVGYIYDDFVTEPAVYQYYEYYLLDPDVEDEDKAMFHIAAHGSVTLVDRAIQDQTLPGLKPFADDPSYGINKKKFLKELLKSKRFDPSAFMNSEDEQRKIDALPPPEDPRVSAAKIGQDTDIKVAMIGAQVKGQAEVNTSEIKKKALELEEQDIHLDAEIRLQGLEMQRQLELLKYANAHRISVVSAQAQLAKTKMTLETQIELSATDHKVDIHKHRNPSPKDAARPLAQTPGKAGNGEAFEQ